jgi:hypothetical protein
MGLFGKKQECPICGGATPRLLPTEIEGQPICKDCDKKASMQRQILEKITLDEYKEHLAYRDENARLHETFNENRTEELIYENLHIDDEQQLLYVGKAKNNPPIIKFSEIKEVRFVEKLNGRKLLIEGKDKYRREVIKLTRDGVETQDSYTTILADKLIGMPRWDNIVSFIVGIDDKMDDSNKPIKYFRIEFILDNPYWKQANYYFVEPKMREGEDVDKNSEVRTYIRRCDDILESANHFVLTVMKDIFNKSK